MPEEVLKLLPKNFNENNSKPLPPTLRHQLEAQFGQDLSDVRVYVSHQTTLVTNDHSAKAFIKGSDIFLAPGSESDLQTMAHEAAHAIQQNSARRGTEVPSGMVKVNTQNKKIVD